MLALTLSVCLLSDPNVCKDVPLNISDTMTPMQCLLSSQQEAAKWLDNNAGWRIAKMTCGRLGRYARA